MHDKHLLGTATVGTKGQIVIPIDAREKLGIKTGDKLYIVGSHHKGVLMVLSEVILEDMIKTMDVNIETLKSFKKNK